MILYLVIFLCISFPMVKSTKKQVNFEDTSLNLYVEDRDNTPASKALVNKLSEKNKIVELDGDKQTILDAMYYEFVDYSLVIKEGYEKNLADIEKGSDSSLFESFHMRDSYSVAMMNLFLGDYVRNVRMKLALGMDIAEAIAAAEEDMEREVDIEMVRDPEKAIMDENFTENFAIYFRLLSYILVAVITSSLCPILLSLNREDQKKRIACSRVSSSSFIIQSFAGSLVLVLIIWLAFMCGGMLLYGGVYRGTNCMLAILNTLIFCLFSALFSIFICSFRPGITVVGMIAQIFGLGMAFLCGAFIPQYLLDEKVLSVARFLPGFWYVRANDLLCGAQTGSIADVWICFGVQGGFCLLFLLLTLLTRPK